MPIGKYNDKSANIVSYLTPAHDIRVHGEQVHNFPLALVAPLGSEHNGHFVVRLLRSPKSGQLRAILPWPLQHRLPVQRSAFSSVKVNHGAAGRHAAAAVAAPAAHTHTLSLTHRNSFSAFSATAEVLFCVWPLDVTVNLLRRQTKGICSRFNSVEGLLVEEPDYGLWLRLENQNVWGQTSEFVWLMGFRRGFWSSRRNDDPSGKIPQTRCGSILFLRVARRVLTCLNRPPHPVFFFIWPFSF